MHVHWELRCKLLHIYGVHYIIIVPGSIKYTHNTNHFLLRELFVLAVPEEKGLLWVVPPFLDLIILKSYPWYPSAKGGH
jgi:hypothetical protein